MAMSEWPQLQEALAEIARLTAAQLEKEAHMDCYQYGTVPAEPPVPPDREQLADLLENGPGALTWAERRDAALALRRAAELEAKLRQSGQDLAAVVNDKTRLEAEVERTRDAWMETAAFHHRNEEYYRGLVIQIGEMLPLPDAYVSDDGSGQDSVLCAKVPELVQALVAEVARITPIEQAAQALRLVIESTRMHPQVRAEVDAALACIAS